ncbi:MAG: helix-turn-helix domain-containing protein [Acidimicrobiia bacterium]|nr:MAG: helix-turn-helix domain-containing protein [Acidimicrobiia bacterium]
MALETYLEDRLLSTEEAATYLNCSQQTLRNWRVQGRGPTAVKVGAFLVRYRQRDLDAWLEEQNTGADPR